MADIAVAEVPPTVKVAIVYNPFRAAEVERHDIVYQPESTIADYMKGLPLGVTYVVGFRGEAYEEERWSSLKPEPDEGFSIVCVPEGGDGAKSIFRLVAMIAIGALALWGGPLLAGFLGFSGTFAGAVAGGFIAVAGAMLVNAILPAPKLTTSSQASSSTYGYDGPKNTAAEGVVVPVVYGTWRVGGNIVDCFTKSIGDDQYLFMRTILNDGAVKAITDIQINKDDVANYSNVETRISLGTDDGAENDWFGESVSQVPKSAKLTQAWTAHTTTGPVDKLRLAILWPNGLFHSNNKGGYDNASVTLNFQYKPHGSDDSAWAPLTSQTIRTFQRYTGGPAVLPGYGTAPDIISVAGYTQSYGNPVTPSGVLNPALTYSQDVEPVLYYAHNDLTGTDRPVLRYTLPSGSSHVSVEAMAELLVKNPDDLTASYQFKAMVMEVGTDSWVEFGHDIGTVNKIGVNNGLTQFPFIYRTWSTSLDPTKTYEVMIVGGSPTQIDVAHNDGGSGSVTISRSQTSAVRYDYESGTLANGVYDVRVQRTTPDSGTAGNTIDTCYLSDVSEILIDNIQYVGTANLSLKIKMDDQLSSIPTVTALVQGSIVKQYDMDGNIVAEDWSQWPCWHTLDILMNENRGRGLSAANIDFSSFKEWEAYCIANNLALNIVFDEDSNVWDSVQTCCRIGHASLVRVGTRWSVVVDKPGEEVMMFNDTNIIKGTFQTDWLSLDDRANEIQYTFFDADNDYTQTTIRVTDPSAPNVGAGLRVAQITERGVTNIDQAKFNVEKQLRENALLKKVISFEAPLDSVGLSVGDIAAVQHTSANYGRNIGSGRLKAGSTESVLQLDCPVTLQAGVTYKALVLHSAVKRYDVTVTSVNDSGVFVTGLPDEVARVSRFVQGGVETAILNIVDGSPADRIEVENTTGIVAGAAQLWATDVVDEQDISTGPGTYTQVTLALPLLKTPDDFALWMIGPVETVKRLYRLRTISGQSLFQRKLSFTEYNDQVYLPLGTSIAPAAPPPSTVVAQAQGLGYSYPQTFVGNRAPVTVTISWLPGDPDNYGGADIYLRTNGGQWVYQRSVQNVTTWQTQLQPQDSFQFRVVEFDLKLNRANVSYAPVVGGIVQQTAIDLAPPTNLNFTTRDYKVTALVDLDWTASTSSPIDGYLVQYAVIDDDAYNAFIANGTLPLLADDDWDSLGLNPATTAEIDGLSIGYMIARVRAVYGMSVSPWTYNVFQIDAPAIPQRVTGLTLDNAVGDPLNGIFTGKDAKFSWRDSANQASSLAAGGADVNGMDFIWRDYQVEIKSPSGQLLRRETTTDPYYVYTFEKNVEDSAPILGAGRASRDFIIEVRMRGRQGQLSDPAWMEAKNPPPAVVIGALVPDGNSVSLVIVPPPDTDLAGLLVWSSAQSGFTPSDENLVWKGAGKPIWFENTGQVYARWAAYDTFDDETYNISDEGSVVVEGISATAFAEDIINRLNLIDGPDTLEGSVDWRIAQEVLARVNAVNGVAASVVTETNSRTTADDALSSRIDALVSEFGDATALVATEATTRATADEALSDRIDTVQAYFGTGIDAAHTVASLITTEQTARANADEALSNSITTVQSYFGGGIDGSHTVTAAIATEATTRANADEGLSDRIDAVVATANGNTAAITSEQTARANADQTLSNRIDAVTSWFGTGIDGSHTVAAAISNEATTRASADSANALSISNVSSTVDGHTATLSSYGSSINGLLARVGLTLNVNGYITGWSMNNNGASGDFTLIADNFKFYTPGGNVSPFYISGSQVYIDNAHIQNLDANVITQNGHILTAHLADGSVTKVGYSIQGGTNVARGDQITTDGVAWPNWVTPQTFPTVLGSRTVMQYQDSVPITVIIEVSVQTTSDANNYRAGINFVVYRDGSPVYVVDNTGGIAATYGVVPVGRPWAEAGFGYAAVSYFSFTEHFVGAGDHTYTVRAASADLYQHYDGEIYDPDTGADLGPSYSYGTDGRTITANYCKITTVSLAK